MGVFSTMTTNSNVWLRNATEVMTWRTDTITSAPQNLLSHVEWHTIPDENSSLIGNISANNPDEDPLPSTSFMIFYFFMRFLFSAFAVFGNMLTIIAVVRYESLHNNTSYLICSLAAGDVLGGCLTPIVIIHQSMSDQPIFIPLCLIEKTISIISAGLNLFNIMWIAMDRYIYIAHPLKYQLWVTPTKTFIIIGLTWVIISIEIAMVFIFTNRLKLGMTCKIAVLISKLGHDNILMPQVVILAVITVCMYIAIARIANKQGKAIAALKQPYDTYEAAIHRQQKKIAKMMVMVLGTFLICYIPQIIATLVLSSIKNMFTIQMEKITVLVYWANTWLNPIIYAWKSEHFRVAFRKLLGLTQNTVVPWAAGNREEAHKADDASP